MLHTFNEGHMGWTCPCGSEQTAHVSHPRVEHPSQDEYETVVEGTTTDEQGRVWTRSLTRPTGRQIVVDPGVVALPPCATCGTQTFLKARFTDEDLASVATHDQDGNPTTASMDAAHRHMAVAEHLKRLGKGPDDIRKGQT